ncbi:hypothetical protein [Leptotrichia massiliensis]|jgi:hypothetical protein
MDRRIRLILLKLLNENGNISNLEKSGYSFYEIASEYSKLINEDFITSNGNNFILSEKGLSELENAKKIFKESKNWKIYPYLKYKINKTDKYEIYIE